VEHDALRVRLAAAVLRRGGVVLHATEGVWGLACDPFDPRAVRRVLELKGRSVAMGLIVIGDSSAMFASELAGLEPRMRARIEASWPGPNTWIVPNVRFPAWITGAHRTVALRVPGHAQARALCHACGGPLVSTSANPSGRPAPRTALAARRYFQSVVDYVLAGATVPGDGPSRIRDATTGATLRA
jgi:L-threonylcarbamoyladenylate synthase